MSRYKHLTLFEREKIFLLSAQNKSLSVIAKEIGRNKSTISRELNRNSFDGSYSPSVAQDKYHKRRASCRRHRLLANAKLFHYVNSYFLEHQWSPEQISGRLKHEESDLYVSYTTIYRAIYAGMFDTPKEKHSHGCRGAIRKLRHRGKSRHTQDYVERRGKIIISNPIAERPNEANSRERIGDWEADTVVCKKNHSCFVTLTDRKSRFLLSKKIEAKNSICVRDALIDLLRNEPCYTITPDRGKEFAKHAEVTAALNGLPFYFPLPHHPWQRGTNENTNGLLREYFPKGTDISSYDNAYIQSKVDELNMRPRKCLGYRTPYEVYFEKVLHLT